MSPVGTLGAKLDPDYTPKGQLLGKRRWHIVPIGSGGGGGGGGGVESSSIHAFIAS